MRYYLNSEQKGSSDPEDFPEDFIRLKIEQRKFIEQLLDNKKSQNFKIPVKINAELRSYQQEVVSWCEISMKFLRG